MGTNYTTPAFLLLAAASQTSYASSEGIETTQDMTSARKILSMDFRETSVDVTIIDNKGKNWKCSIPAGHAGDVSHTNIGKVLTDQLNEDISSGGHVDFPKDSCKPLQ